MIFLVVLLFALFVEPNATHRENPEIRLVSSNYADRYIRHRNFELFIDPDSDSYISDSIFKLQKGLSDDHDDGYFSFESINYPSYYIRHQNYRMKISEQESSELYKDDASWKFVPALNNELGYISLQSKNYQIYYARHRNYELWIDEQASASSSSSSSSQSAVELFRDDASFRVECSANCPEPEIRLVSSNYPDHYIRHRNNELFIDPEEASDLYLQDSTFILKSGLSGDAYVSFESINYPDYYIRHQGYRMRISSEESSDLYKDDSSFRVVPALNGAYGYVSFQSKNYPTHYARHRDYELWIDEEASVQLFKDDASFKVVCADDTDCPQYLYTFLNLNGGTLYSGGAVSSKVTGSSDDGSLLSIDLFSSSDDSSGSGFFGGVGRDISISGDDLPISDISSDDDDDETLSIFTKNVIDDVSISINSDDVSINDAATYRGIVISSDDVSVDISSDDDDETSSILTQDVIDDIDVSISIDSDDVSINGGAAVEDKEDDYKDKDIMYGDVIELYGIATFTGVNTGVLGEVVVDENGNVEIDLDLSSFDSSLCEFSGDESYLYYIYNEWNYDDSEEKYNMDCNTDTIGELMDPFATSTLCSDISEEIDYFNCKMGDLSGRFGVASPDSYTKKVFIAGNISYSSSSGKKDGFCDLRLSPEAVYKKSVAFHCNNDAKTFLFCVPFEMVVYDEGRS